MGLARIGRIGGRSTAVSLAAAPVALLAGAVALTAAAPAAAGGAFIYNSGEDVFEVADIPPDVYAIAVQSLIAQNLRPAEAAAEDAQLLSEDYSKLKLGYRCSIFGLFYAYLHWWDCKAVFYKWTSSDTFEYMPLDLVEYKAHMQTQTSDPDILTLDVAAHKAVIEAIEKKAGKKIADAYPLSSVKMGMWKKNGRWFFAGGLVLLIVGWILLKRRKAAAAAPPPAFPPPGAPPAQYPPAGAPPQG